VGVKAIENLMQKKGKFDYILLETTGLADPGPIAAMFWLDDDLGSEIYLDGIVTMVDSKHIFQQISEKRQDGSLNEAVRQIALADLVLVNKTDLVSGDALKDVRQRVQGINSMAKIVETHRSKIDLGLILDLHAYDTSERALPQVLQNVGSHHIDTAVSTVTFEVERDVIEEQLDQWLQDLLWEKTLCNSDGDPMNIMRMKGVLSVVDESRRVIVQGVYELFEKERSTEWHDRPRINRLVFIGYNLDGEILLQSFKKFCL
jgi:G3E family GTPase